MRSNRFTRGWKAGQLRSITGRTVNRSSGGSRRRCWISNPTPSHPELPCSPDAPQRVATTGGGEEAGGVNRMGVATEFQLRMGLTQHSVQNAARQERTNVHIQRLRGGEMRAVIRALALLACAALMPTIALAQAVIAGSVKD